MIIFIISVTIYAGLLILIRPAPASLKSAQISFSENFKLVWASMFSGIFIIFIFLVTTRFGFVIVDENIYSLLAMSNNINLFFMRPLQLFTHLLIHGNVAHLAANVVGLGLASVYERRVGANRYFEVLLVGCLASIPSILFYSGNITVCGISGGVFGLAAAYFTDEDKLTAKEWFTTILMFVFILTFLTLDEVFKSQNNENLNLKIDHLGHFFGAAGAIIYCRLQPQRLVK